MARVEPKGNATAFNIDGNSRYSQTKSSRSVTGNFGFEGTRRRRTFN